jgi:hypothetical protein
MYERAGDLQRSLQFWWEIYEDAEDDRVQSIAWQHVYDLRVRLDLQVIEAAVGRYRAERGNTPASLQELIDAGYLSGAPENPNGTPYVYNPITGEIRDPEAGQRRGGQ